MTNMLRRSTLARWLVAAVCFAGAAVLIAVPPVDSLVSTLTAPADGQNWAGSTFQWTAVDGADAYYLYVGTAVGLKDIVNTGELQVTSKPAVGLPAGVTLYARMWTKHGGVWRYRDSTFAVYPLTTTLTSPAAGQTNVPVTGSFAWQAIPNVQAYYLYVGTTVGANNVINTGEKQTTSYPYVGLQPQTTYYARMWTKMGGVWRYVDSTFTTAALTSQLITPAHGATNVSLPVTLQWSPVASVQAYYLYLGTGPGLKDLVNTGETTVTAWTTAVLPPSSTIYARLWTKTGGTWRYVDSSFQTGSGVAAPLVATLTYPLNDAPQVPVPVTFQWNAVANAQVYYLYVGSATGLNDLVDSRELTQTSFTASLPGASTVHARLWTRVNGIWRYVDTKFGTQAVTARMSYPVSGLTVATDTTFTWNAITGAQAYRLQIGTTQGGANVLDSGETTETQWNVAVPDSSSLYARLWTRHNDTWRYSDSTFSTESLRARFTYPTVGAVGIDPQHPFQWTAADDADGYTLQIGTSWGANDLLDTGEIQSTSFLPSGLPVNQTLYARIRTRTGSITRDDDTVFTLANSVAPAEIVEPADGESSFGTGVPFRWTEVDMATGYRLRIGTSAGAGDLHDSGEIFVTRRFVRDLPIGVTLYGEVQTLIGTS
jgi:hypothetical protein